MTFLSKYGVARHIYIPMVKRGVVDHAVSADWTPAAGDVKISKDGGAAANVTNLPVAIAMGNSTIWDYSFTATEMQAAQVMVTIGDSATKAVEDSGFIIETYGNASAQHAVDLADSVRAGLTALPNATVSTVGGLPVAVDTSGRVDVLKVNGTSQTAGDIYSKVSGLTFTGAGKVDASVRDWVGDTIPARNTTGVPIVDTKYITGTLQTARDLGTSVLISPGTGTGQLDVTAGVVKANLVQILGTALTETAGQIAAGFKQFFNIASPTSTMNTITTVTTATTATNLTNAPTNGDLTATMKTSVTTAATAATPTVTLAAAAVTAIWDKATSALTTAGSIGKLLVDNVNASISTIKTQTDKLTFTVANQIDANVLDWKSATAPAMTGDAYARLGAPAGASVSADIAALPTAAVVKAQAVAALNTDTYAEPGQGAPGATITLAAKINYLYKAWRNKKTQSSTVMSLLADDGVTVDQKATVSDDGTTFTSGKIDTGP